MLDVPAIIERSELVLLAVPGDQLADLVAGLAATGAWQPGQLVAHTAPGFGTAVLAPALAAGAIPLAISPAMAFTGTSIDLIRLRESWCAVTAPGPGAADRAGARRRDGQRADRRSPRRIAPPTPTRSPPPRASRRAIVAQAAGALRELGIENPGQVLGPLVRSAVENALAAAQAGVDDATTIDLATSAGEAAEEAP